MVLATYNVVCSRFWVNDQALTVDVAKVNRNDFVR